MNRAQIKPRRKPRRGRVKDEKYLAFIREWPCYICFLQKIRRLGGLSVPSHNPWWLREVWAWETARTCGITEAAHVGIRGLGQKCSDREAIPLGEAHHRTGPDSHHVLGKKFWEHHKIDRDAAIAFFQAAYSMEVKK